MGAADVVPGVSGGTIAFISGIYEELLNSISSVNLGTLKILKKDGIKAAWNSINGNFLFALLSGILISALSLAKAVSWLLKNEPILLWAFFFGLVTASVIYIAKQVTKWDVKNIIGLICGTGIAFYITIMPPLGDASNSAYLFLCGMIAICAMILPGISGSFILLLLGAYKPIIEAFSSLDFKIIAIVGSGCVIGLLAFSRILKWLFNNFKNLTLSILTGFLIGSLNMLWPWKETISTRINSHGEEIPFIRKNIAPSENLVLAIVLAIIGFAIIFGMEIAAKKLKSK